MAWPGEVTSCLAPRLHLPAVVRQDFDLIWICRSADLCMGILPAVADMLTGITDTLFPHTTDIAIMRRELSHLLRVRVYCTERNTHKRR